VGGPGQRYAPVLPVYPGNAGQLRRCNLRQAGADCKEGRLQEV